MKKIALGFIASGLLFAGACSSDDGDSSDAELIEWFENEGETPEAAACFAEELSSYSVADLDTFNEDDGPSDDLAADAAAAAEVCADL